MEFELLDGEQVMHQGPANRRDAVDDPTIPLPRKRKKRKKAVRGNPLIQGTLYLTNQRLVHVSSKGEAVYMKHEDIEDIQASNVSKTTTNVLTVDLLDGDAYDFMFEGHPEWKLIFPTVINHSKKSSTGA